MSGVGSVQGQYGQGNWMTSSVNELRASGAQEARVGGATTEINQQMEVALGKALDSAEIDQETRESLTADLEPALNELFWDGNSARNPGKVKQTIDGVFEKHGLSGEDVLGQIRPSGGLPPGMCPPPGGGGGLVGQTDTEDTSQTDLLETLLAQLNGEEDDSESDVSLTPQEMAQQLLDTLFGFDEEA